ncbi:zinc-finger homeodomain protein 2-like [Cynara cardunculus var. scolymus]|uniref:zinc-finger homeodomain protein 2-like n=1 Tax=Cynara cardunculus var. scolymus TaxID=59895 RepID=UPI000D62B28B|nr:zinc-finger homeodomain protein 2-like [Cynara cardunculus var. scolymus]
MEFHRHTEDDDEEEEEDDEETGIQRTSGRMNGGIAGFRYLECLKNHAVGIGKQAVDGCREFMAAGGEGTLEALKCAACNCHRNFHRKEPEHPQASFQHHQIPPPATYYYHHRPVGYLHVTTPSSSHPHRPPLALPSTSRDNLEEISNPNSEGSKKRFRTKFTESQKERMLSFAEGLGWRIQKEEEAAVRQFCEEIGIKRKVLKVWMHNNKHTLGVTVSLIQGVN